MGTPTACKRMVSGTISLRYSRFFSPFPHGTCSLSVSWKYLALPDGPGKFRQDFTCPALLRILLHCTKVTCTGLSPFVTQLSRWFHLFGTIKKQSYNPIIAETTMVWAYSRSLATTKEITFVFFSSRYLDVSVPRVCFPLSRDIQPSAGWVAPFGHLRIKGYLHLPEAFRSLSRPSSPPRAKASPIRSYYTFFRFLLNKLFSIMSKNLI
jgi:hypothetical protein